MWDLEADACIIKLSKKIGIRPRRKAMHEPSGLTLEREFAVDFSKKKWRIFEAQKFRRHRKHMLFDAILWGFRGCNF